MNDAQQAVEQHVPLTPTGTLALWITQASSTGSAGFSPGSTLLVENLTRLPIRFHISHTR
jgi:hypothetical protein